MKPKATGPRPAEIVPVPRLAEDLQASIRVMDHVQSGLRQLMFGVAAVVPADKRTPELEAHLAALHEDEARYHAREATWLRQDKTMVIDASSSSDSGGAPKRKQSRGGSSRSTRKKSPSPARAPAVP